MHNNFKKRAYLPDWWHKYGVADKKGKKMLIGISIFSYLLIFLLLLALAYRDLKEYILPDYLNCALALAFSSFHISIHWEIIPPLNALTGALAGGGLLLAIRTVANKFYQNDSLGLGDVKLMTAAGIGLGYPNILLALSLGAFIGALHGVCIAYAAKKVNKSTVRLGETTVPAGLGLTIGIALVMLHQFGFEWLNVK